MADDADADADTVMESIDDVPSLGSIKVEQPSSTLFHQVDQDTLQPSLTQPESEPRDSMDVDPPVRQAASDTSSLLSGPATSDSSRPQSVQSVLDTTPPRGNQQVEVVLWPRPKLDALPYSSTQSGLVYDMRMRFHAEPLEIDEEKDMDDYHPEDPLRIEEIYQELKKAGLVPDEFSDPVPQDVYRLWRIPFEEASSSDIQLVHSKRHYNWLKGARELDKATLEREASGMDSIYMNRSTFFCAKLSTGGAIAACDAVVSGRVKNSIAVIRPPGHHAEKDRARGFCFFDNVAVAAKACQRAHPTTCRKILIIDWDVHHGNGVQQAFYNDPNVLYISIHVHKNGSFYPHGDAGDHLHCGEGAGLGFNVNIPWPSHGMKDGDYLYAFQRVIMPIAQEFDPDLVIVSAGFDAAEGDILGGCHVTPAGYAHLTHMLMSLAGGKIAVCLEGGYNLRSIARSALAVTRTLMGEPPDRLVDSEPTKNGIDTTHLVIREQSRFWKRVFPVDRTAILKNRVGGIPTVDRLDNVVRRYQVETMWDKHRMRPLPILREKISKMYENQVLATPNYDEAVPLLVILHDPPEVMANPDARTGKLELHNAWLVSVIYS
jgi:histone deacetylase 6